MTLGEKQEIFSRNVGLLLIWLSTEGYRFRIKEVQRTQEQALLNHARGIGSRNSLHIDSLAIDIDLFDKNGGYLTDHLFYSEAGRYWKSLGGIWGGDFKKTYRSGKDGRHFEYGNQMATIWQRPVFEEYPDLRNDA